MVAPDRVLRWTDVYQPGRGHGPE